LVKTLGPYPRRSGSPSPSKSFAEDTRSGGSVSVIVKTPAPLLIQSPAGPEDRVPKSRSPSPSASNSSVPRPTYPGYGTVITWAGLKPFGTLKNTTTSAVPAEVNESITMSASPSWSTSPAVTLALPDTGNE
jgi:hypothetical protein